MDKYTESIKIKLLEKDIILNEKAYLKIKQHIDSAVKNQNINEYNKHLKILLEKSKGDLESPFLYLLVGILMVFYFDYRSDLIFNIIGWFLIVFGIFFYLYNANVSKKNAYINLIMVNPANFSGLEKDLENFTKSKIMNQSLVERLEEIENLKINQIITEEEYEVKRKQIIEKY